MSKWLTNQIWAPKLNFTFISYLFYIQSLYDFKLCAERADSWFKILLFAVRCSLMSSVFFDSFIGSPPQSQNHFEARWCTFFPADGLASIPGVNAAEHTSHEEQVCCYLRSESESYVSGITPRWVGMWIMPLCECERVSADHHHRAPGDATLFEGLLWLIAPKWETFFY